MGEHTIRCNGVDLAAQTFGKDTDPAVLLMAGNGCSMYWWRDEFCRRLAADSRFVIRYDYRDTGRSVTYEPGHPGYRSYDLAQDAAALVGALGVRPAHLVGWSMGGALAVLVALERALAGSRPFDDEYARSLHERGRQNGGRSSGNHVLMEPGSAWRHRLPELTVPTLVIHGREDPLHPLEHGQALAREIPGAALLALESTGHELPPAVWDLVIPAIVERTKTEVRTVMTAPETDFPAGIGAPARRALAAAGYTKLEQLTGVTESEIGQLHGVGPKALRLLRDTLACNGQGFAPLGA
jgi:pimeloyl-ACP methyl ester carboxylesterase